MTTVNSFPLTTVAASTVLPPVQFTYSSTTTDADPGEGQCRLNNSDPASATAAYLDNAEIGGTDISDWLDTFDDSGNSSNRGTLIAYQSSTPSVFHIYTVTGSVTDGTGYRKLALTHLAGNGTFTDATAVTMLFVQRGATGDTGDAATIEVGTVTTGAAGSSATVENVGTSGAAVFDFSIPQGETGATGLTDEIMSSDVTGTTYTVISDDLGKRLRTTNSSAVAVTLPNSLPQGFSILVCQTGTGQVTFAADTGATLNQRGSFTKTAGQWSEVSLTVDSNTDDVSAVWVLSGDVGV